MSSRRGFFFKCDRCSSWVFMDESKMSVDEQVDFKHGRLPEKWMRIKGADLCPDCAKTFSELFDKFLKQV